MTFITGILIGLVVGWNFLPQPIWVKNLVTLAYNKIVGKNEDI